MKQPVVINGTTVDLGVIATYMDDDLRERIHNEPLESDQAYIDRYIEVAKTEDPQFLEVLQSEFNVPFPL